MLPTRAVISLCLLITMSISPALSAPAASAPTSKPAAAGFTQRDYIDAVREYNRRTMVDAYDKVGSRDPKWDAEAKAFLEAMALRMAVQAQLALYQFPEPTSLEKLTALGEAARKKGCDDPMVGYCYAALLYEGGKVAEAKQVNDEVSEKLTTSQYPVTRAQNAAGRQMALAKDEAGRAAAWGKFRDLILASISTWDFKDIDRRIVYEHTMLYLARASVAEMKDLSEAARIKNADPWLARMLEGNYHIQAAWDARGGGVAGTVSREGWEGFFVHLGKGRDALTAAWNLHPEYPEAATVMIPVAMGGQEKLNEHPRDWFERATKAQIDYADAYERYRYSLLPRWGGSPSELQRFATECLASDRFDTVVPWEFAVTLETMIWDFRQPEMWSAKGVFESVREMCDGYVGALKPGKAADFFLSYEAAVAARSAHYPEARKALEQLGDRVDDEAMRRVGLMPAYASSSAFAFTGPDAESLVAAEQKGEMHQLGEAIAAFEAAAKKAADDKSANERAARYINSRLQQLKWEKQFESGEWVDVQPKDAAMLGWEAVAGTWSIEKDGTLVGKGNADGLMLTFVGTYLSPRFEIDGEMELSTPKEGAKTFFGMSLANAQPAKFHGWWMARSGDKVDCYNNWTSRFHRELEIGPHNTVNMTQWDDRLMARLNGHMTTNQAQTTPLMGPRMYLALGAPGAALGTEVRLTKLRVRKLGEEPKQ